VIRLSVPKTYFSAKGKGIPRRPGSHAQAEIGCELIPSPGALITYDNVEYALQNFNQPIGVSTYRVTRQLPDVVFPLAVENWHALAIFNS
jgi:hypothetical protein